MEKVCRGGIVRVCRGGMVRVCRGGIVRVCRGGIVRVCRGGMVRVYRGGMVRVCRGGISGWVCIADHYLCMQRDRESIQNVDLCANVVGLNQLQD